MLIWKRKVGDVIVLGDDAAIVVKEVVPHGGGRFKGSVTLGFEVADGVMVQRAETYLKQAEVPDFPQFFRVVDKETDRIFGYSFEPASEGSTLSYGYKHELVTGYDEMIEDDHRLTFYIFRSEAEAEACVLGVSASDLGGIELGVVKHRFGRLWLVMIDHYTGIPEEVNPSIHSFVTPSPRVMSAIEGVPRRKAG